MTDNLPPGSPSEAAHASHGESGLKTGQLGFAEVLFQSLASAAPGLGVTLAVIVGASFAGGALSLSLVFALIGVLLVASCIGQMAKRFPSAGGFYTFVANGIHPALGTFVAWLYLIVWMVFPSTLFLPFGGFLSQTLNDELGWSKEPVWIVSSLLCIAFVYWLVSNGATLSTKASIVLGSLEFAILGVLGVWLIVKAGSNNTLSVFTTSHADVKGFVGAAGILGGMIYAIYGFVGFENSVPLAEEAKDPRRTVTRVMLIAPLILGVFLIFCTYAATVYYGPERFESFPASNGGDAWIGLAKEVWHNGWYVLLFALLNSAVASANGAANAATRHIFAMARIRLLPSALAQTDPHTGAPIAALRVLTAFSIVVTLASGLILDGGPFEAFGFLGTIETAVAITLFILVTLACLIYFIRNRDSEFNAVLHVIIPILGIMIMLPTLMAAVGVGSSLLSFISPLTSPLIIGGYIAIAWVILGIIYTAWIWIAHQDRARQTEALFLD